MLLYKTAECQQTNVLHVLDRMLLSKAPLLVDLLGCQNVHRVNLTIPLFVKKLVAEKYHPFTRSPVYQQSGVLAFCVLQQPQ
ncbi:hypothetical protein ACU8KH_05507 [Lachancea thermotolerans]